MNNYADHVAELYRRASANLTHVYSGKARADKDRLSAQRKTERKQRKTDERRLKRLPKLIEKLRDELRGLDEYFKQVEEDPNPLGYAEGMDESQKQGLLEEIDAAREGCMEELLCYENERDELRAKL